MADFYLNRRKQKKVKTMDLDKDKYSGILRQARFVLERADSVVKESQSTRFPHHTLNDAQRIFSATVAHQAKLLAGSALEQAGFKIACDIPSIDALLAGDFIADIEKFMSEAAKFLGTHPELLASARVNVSQLILRSAVEYINHASGVLEQSESISGAPIGRRGLWNK